MLAYNDSSLRDAGNSCPASPRWTRRATAGLTLICAHYGVISEITPPVCASAYAAAGIAGSNPFKTGLSAFALGIGKLLVPMVFVYSPAMLIVLDDYFTYAEFFQTTLTCGLGVFMLSASVAGYFLVNMNGPSRAMFALGGLLLVSPNTTACYMHR